MVGSRSLRVVVVVAALIMASSAGVWAQSQARPRPIGLMGVIPGDSLFCVRITRLDNTLGAVNEYLEGVAPESFDAQKAVYSKLGGLLGDEQLRGVNKNGGFALFALSVPGEEKTQPSQHPRRKREEARLRYAGVGVPERQAERPAHQPDGGREARADQSGIAKGQRER
jgi:hypothetical protein